MTILEKLYKMNNDEQWDYFMCEMTQEEFTELRGNVPLEKFSINRIQPERSKREDVERRCGALNIVETQ